MFKEMNQRKKNRAIYSLMITRKWHFQLIKMFQSHADTYNHRDFYENLMRENQSEVNNINRRIKKLKERKEVEVKERKEVEV